MAEIPDGAVVVGGAAAVEMVTGLLQRMRLEGPDGGVFEAADLQWWSRRERRTDAAGQLFWLDGTGAPEAAVICTEWGAMTGCDVLVRAGSAALEPAVWEAAVRRVGAAGGRPEFSVPAGWVMGAGVLAAAGYRRTGEAVVSCWLEAAGRPPVPPLPDGYRLRSRAQAASRPHWLIARNNPDVEERLRSCSLYDPELDLMAETADGQVAGYGVFWADPVTGVGLVEPMRTEQGHEGRGIASHVLAAGLERLAGRGCSRLKVSSDRGLYLRAGFRPLPEAAAQVWTRPAGAG